MTLTGVRPTCSPGVAGHQGSTSSWRSTACACGQTGPGGPRRRQKSGEIGRRDVRPTSPDLGAHMTTRDLTGENFNRSVYGNDNVLVYFWAPLCVP
jgi:hypothetical protein